MYVCTYVRICTYMQVDGKYEKLTEKLCTYKLKMNIAERLATFIKLMLV